MLEMGKAFGLLLVICGFAALVSTHRRQAALYLYYAILFTENPTSNYAAYIPIRVYARSLTSC